MVFTLSKYPALEHQSLMFFFFCGYTIGEVDIVLGIVISWFSLTSHLLVVESYVNF